MRIATLLFFLLASLGNAANEWRTFTDKGGRTLEAAVVKVNDSYAVLKLKKNGRKVRIDFDKLSDEDVDFLDSYEPEEAVNEETPKDEPDSDRLYPKTKEEIRGKIREIKSRPKPDDISREVHEATEQLNIYRYLSGIPYEVEADAEMSAKAEDAAKACEKHGGLSHDIGHSTDKCNLAGGGGMVTSVAQYIGDFGDKNRERRGHRAWCLNPPMDKVGFGEAAGGYSAMWCGESGGKSMRDSWAYPGKGLFPLKYMHGNAWSLYGAGVPESADKVEVKVYKLSFRPDKPFAANDEIPGREIPVKYVSIASINGINFEPAEPAKPGIYWVSVKGSGIIASYLVELY
jgi:hypothetical protein